MRKPDTRILLFSLLAAAIVAGACSRRPSGVLSKEEMAELLADIYEAESVADANGRAFATDSSKRAFLQSVYIKHDVTRAEVDSSFKWYGYNLEKYMEVYDRTIELLEQRLEKAQDVAGSSTEGIAEMSVNLQGDSVDVWPGMRWRRFTTSMPNDIITFALNSDMNWENGDVYMLRSKIHNNNGPLNYNITAEYSDGTMEYISRSMPGDGWHELTFALDSARHAQKVYGTISYTPSTGETVFIDSISLMRTRWGGHYRDARGTVSKFDNRTQHKIRKDISEKQPLMPLNTPPKELKMDSRQLTPIDETRVMRPGRLKEKLR